MASFGRGKTRTKHATKQEIAGKVQEIQMRQKNWMEQREAALKQKPTSATKSAEKIAPSKNRTSTKENKPSLTENLGSSSNNQMHKERFKSWLASRERREEEDLREREEDLREEDVDILRVSSARTPGYASPEPGWEETSGNYKDYQQSMIMSQMMSAEDFDAKADNILSRVKYGLDKQDGSGDDNNKGTSDLSSHYCPICRNIMKGDQHSPLIYVPCGHNTCVSCSKGRQICPCCGSQASSKTRNIMLMQIIEEYHKNKQKFKEEQNSKIESNEYNSQSLETAPRRKRGINKTKYREEYENLKMRQEVLKVEIKDIQGQINSYVKEISAGEKQVLSVKREEEKVIGQIQSLQEKLRALEQHRAQYETDCECTRQAQKEAREKLHQTQDILLTVEIQMEKARLLAEQ
ncbi:uncharacterized protein LOC133193828 [Saccostrea echinata]|uniref:uncharacterized protein LOC133193828 n=1 Tax=Saccostrea echinata TaxID=191078 RepID=UPI002A82F954|nr:uncharacterized protein LOC133193828 [Saccostrea echinata]